MREEDRAKWKSKRLASGDILQIRLVDVTPRALRARTRNNKWLLRNSIRRQRTRSQGADLAINDSDKMNRRNCSRSCRGAALRSVRCSIDYSSRLFQSLVPAFAVYRAWKIIDTSQFFYDRRTHLSDIDYDKKIRINIFHVNWHVTDIT